MKTVHIALDADLLKAIDRLAARLKVNRSALVREALRTYLRQMRERDREGADRAGYARFPEDKSDASWDKVAAASRT